MYFLTNNSFAKINHLRYGNPKNNYSWFIEPQRSLHIELNLALNKSALVKAITFKYGSIHAWDKEKKYSFTIIGTIWC